VAKGATKTQVSDLISIALASRLLDPKVSWEL
jgi:hypothetical protein